MIWSLQDTGHATNLSEGALPSRVPVMIEFPRQWAHGYDELRLLGVLPCTAPNDAALHSRGDAEKLIVLVEVMA